MRFNYVWSVDHVIAQSTWRNDLLQVKLRFRPAAVSWVKK